MPPFARRATPVSRQLSQGLCPARRKIFKTLASKAHPKGRGLLLAHLTLSGVLVSVVSRLVGYSNRLQTDWHSNLEKSSGAEIPGHILSSANTWGNERISTPAATPNHIFGFIVFMLLEVVASPLQRLNIMMCLRFGSPPYPGRHSTSVDDKPPLTFGSCQKVEALYFLPQVGFSPEALTKIPGLPYRQQPQVRGVATHESVMYS